MSRFNLKNNPELAKERHREQNRAWYQRNKEYVIAMQRERRLTQKIMKQCLVAQETHSLDDVWQSLDTLKQNGAMEHITDLIKIETGKRMIETFNKTHRYNLKDGE